jgi:ABC-2 type transport system ATP-binding protein
MSNFLENLKRKDGTTILLTLTTWLKPSELCARIGFLAHGKLVAEGTVEELTQKSQRTNS